eukprot:12756-Heterococcus_DN1.PRE.4
MNIKRGKVLVTMHFYTVHGCTALRRPKIVLCDEKFIVMYACCRLQAHACRPLLAVAESASLCMLCYCEKCSSRMTASVTR